MNTNPIIIVAGLITHLNTTGGTAPYSYRAVNNPHGFVVSNVGDVAIPSCLVPGVYPLGVEVIDSSATPVAELHNITITVVAGATATTTPTATATATATGAPVTTPTVAPHVNPLVIPPYTPPAAAATPPFVLPHVTPAPMPTELDTAAKFAESISDGHAKVLRAARGLTPVAADQGHGSHGSSGGALPLVLASVALALALAFGVWHMFTADTARDAEVATATMQPTLNRAVSDIATTATGTQANTTAIATMQPTLNRAVSDIATTATGTQANTTAIATMQPTLNRAVSDIATVNVTATEALQLARQRPQVVRVRVSDPAPAPAPPTAPAQLNNGALTPEQYQAWLAANPPAQPQQPVQIEVVPPGR